MDDSVKFLTNVEAGHPGYFIVVSVGDENEVHGRFIESRKIVFSSPGRMSGELLSYPRRRRWRGRRRGRARVQKL